VQRNKTDAADAELLAKIAELLEYKQEFKVWQVPSANVLEIRACSRRLSELSQQKARANASTGLQHKKSTSRPGSHPANARCGVK